MGLYYRHVGVGIIGAALNPEESSARTPHAQCIPSIHEGYPHLASGPDLHAVGGAKGQHRAGGYARESKVKYKTSSDWPGIRRII